MKNIKLIILVILIIIVAGMAAYLMHNNNNRPAHTIAVSSPVQTDSMRTESDGFDDGLGRADSSRVYEAAEFDDKITRTDIFYRNISTDDIPDRITRTLHENGTAHFHYEYKIELHTDTGYTDITPDNFTTIEGADCSLRKFRFIFNPKFQIIQIARPWNDTWLTPTVAHKTIYELQDGKITKTQSKEIGSICDVAELF